jgi:hypothetical protein
MGAEFFDGMMDGSTLVNIEITKDMDMECTSFRMEIDMRESLNTINVTGKENLYSPMVLFTRANGKIPNIMGKGRQ